MFLIISCSGNPFFIPSVATLETICFMPSKGSLADANFPADSYFSAACRKPNIVGKSSPFSKSALSFSTKSPSANSFTSCIVTPSMTSGLSVPC